MHNTYVNPADPHNEKLKILVENWIQNIFELDAAPQISVTEQACGVDACPCVQTHIVSTHPIKIRTIIGKPLVYIRKWDIETAKWESFF